MVDSSNISAKMHLLHSIVSRKSNDFVKFTLGFYNFTIEGRSQHINIGSVNGLDKQGAGRCVYRQNKTLGSERDDFMISIVRGLRQLLK